MMPCQGCPLQTGVLPAQQVAGQYDGRGRGDGGGRSAGKWGALYVILYMGLPIAPISDGFTFTFIDNIR